MLQEIKILDNYYGSWVLGNMQKIVYGMALEFVKSEKKFSIPPNALFVFYFYFYKITGFGLLRRKMISAYVR